MPDTPNPNILDAMREVEEAAERIVPLSGTDANTLANHAPAIIAFAWRLLEVARAGSRAVCEDDPDNLEGLVRSLERDYPGCLEDKRDG